MVPGADHHGGALRDGRRTFACHPREPRTKLLQASEATRGFGEPKVSATRLSLGNLVGRRYLRRQLHYPVFEGQG